MPAEMFGCWVRLAGKDYIFYEEHTAHLHQAHIQLHELAHILCGHKTLEMAEQPALTLDALIQGLLYALSGCHFAAYPNPGAPATLRKM